MFEHVLLKIKKLYHFQVKPEMIQIIWQALHKLLLFNVLSNQVSEWCTQGIIIAFNCIFHVLKERKQFVVADRTLRNKKCFNKIIKTINILEILAICLFFIIFSPREHNTKNELFIRFHNYETLYEYMSPS